MVAQTASSLIICYNFFFEDLVKKSHDNPRFLRNTLTEKKSHDNPRNSRNTRALSTLVAVKWDSTSLVSS